MSFEDLKKLAESGRSPITIINRGVTPVSLLGIAFIVLKLTGSITWSWWWVLAPFWIPILVTIALVGFIITLCLVMAKTDSTVNAEVEAPKEEIKEEVKKATKKAPKKTSKKKNNGSATEIKKENE